MSDTENAFRDVLNVLKSFQATQGNNLAKALAVLETLNDLKPEKVRSFYQAFLLQSRQALHTIIQKRSISLLAPEIQQLIKFNIQMSAISAKFQQDNKDIKCFSLNFIEDVYDCLSLVEISLFFDLLSQDMHIIQKIPENEKYTLLKISNAILKRLSRTHEVEMRGKIHIFLTKLLPICHRSGTQKKTAEREFSFKESQEDNNPSQNDIPFTLFNNFWSLQKYLNHPENLLNFQVALSEDVLSEDAFDNQKLKDKNKKDPKQLEQIRLNNIQTLVKIISKILFYFDQNPLPIHLQENTKRFPKYLTKYSLFKNQLNDIVFRKIFLTQVLLFCSTQKLHKATFKNDEEKQIFNQLEQDCKTSIRVLFQEEPIIENLIKTESTWVLYEIKILLSFCGESQREILNRLHVMRSLKSLGMLRHKMYKLIVFQFSDHFCQKTLEKKKQLVSKVYEDLRYRQTDSFLNLIQGQRCFNVETTGLEPGMNYYINDVLTEMDPKCNVDEREKCKNLKDYAWKAVRVISKFFLKEMKTNNNNNNKIPDLEELTMQIKESMEKHIQRVILPINVLPNLQQQRPDIIPTILPISNVNILPISAYVQNGQSGLLRPITITPRMTSQQDQDHNQHRRSS